MITSAVRLGELVFKIQRKIRLKFQPSLRLDTAFRACLSTLLSGERLSAVDVGGAVDLQPHWYRLTGNAVFHIFEPHPESRKKIEEKYRSQPYSSDFRVYPEALSGTGGSRTLYITNVPTGSTIIPINLESAYIHPTDPYLFPLKEIGLDTQTMANALATHGVSRVDLVKLDIQGAELEVLESLGQRHLGELLGFELEVSLNDTFRNGTTLRDLASFVDKRGFEILDVKVARAYVQRNGKSAKLQTALGVDDWDPAVSAKAWEFDVVCFRRPEALLAARDISGLRRLISCYCVYGFLLEAYGLVGEMQERSLISAEESSRLQSSVISLKRAISFELSYYRRVLRGLRNLLWGQYLWLRFPTS